MASSRIFVQGIPPNISAGELKKHFSKQGVVTDARTLGNRRIGYIGYKTTEEATKALNYFNKSYLRMSKLSVDFARPVSQRKTGSLSQITSSIEAEQERDYLKSKKRKRQYVNEANVSDSGDNTGNVDLIMNVQKNCSSTVGGTRKVGEKTRKINIDSHLVHGDGTANTDKADFKFTDRTWLEARTNTSLDQEQPSRTPFENDISKSTHRENIASAERDGQNSDDRDLGIVQKVQEDLTGSVAHQGPYRRLFLRNLSYTITEEDIREVFTSFGNIDEIHVPVNSSGIGKGFAFVQYRVEDSAEKAYKAMDDTVFHGRLLQILPSEPKRMKHDEFEIGKLPLKQQMLIRRKAESSSKAFTWNALYMNPDAVMAYISNRLGVSKAEVLDPSSSNAAIIQARAESHVIEETKAYFQDRGVDLDAFNNTIRGDSIILVKNFPFGTSVDELLNLFAEHGEIRKFLMPPSGVTAIVAFQQANAAKGAFRALSYRRFRESILFLEWAPKNLFTPTSIARIDRASHRVTAPANVEDEIIASETESSTLYIRNLSFSTTNYELTNLFQGLSGFLSAKIKTKPDSKDTDKILSMGYGFLEFRTQAQARDAMDAMQGYSLGGHNLVIKFSQKATDTPSSNSFHMRSAPKQRKTKIIVKNLPFEVSKKEMRSLFSSYGQLRSLRIPKKIDRTSRGFAFVEFATSRDAENAMEALKHTHILGRRLVLQFAAEEVVDPEEEIEKMQRKVNSQIDKIALEEMASSRRRKVDFEGTSGE